jgi:branched-chain amino acid transport system ATP-binding protein
MNEKSKEQEFILEVKRLRLDFGGVRALNDVDINVGRKEILAVIGPNGAGKTCLLNCINGFYRPQAGAVVFKDRDITHLPPYRIAKLGIARTFQNIELYSGMSVVDNLMAARHLHYRMPWITDFLYFGWSRREEVAHRAVVEDIIDLLEMQKIRKSIVGTLPDGLRKRVELGRALALEPKLLLLDEPMAGMNVEEKEDMARFILDTFELKEIPVVLVEHDMGVVMDLADRICVIDFGVLIAEGTPEEIKNNPKVIKAYLGEGI